jgi:hypothetical protein
LLSAIDYAALLALRTNLQQRTTRGHGHKTTRPWKASTVRRVTAVAGAILQRCTSDEWKRMLERAPSLPVGELENIEPRWITSEQAHASLARFPKHTADMMRFALATGRRRPNVTDLV